jgi:hypothetical protein
MILVVLQQVAMIRIEVEIAKDHIVPRTMALHLSQFQELNISERLGELREDDKPKHHWCRAFLCGVSMVWLTVWCVNGTESTACWRRATDENLIREGCINQSTIYLI